MLTLRARRCPLRGGGGAAPASQSSDCTTSDRRPGKVLSVINYYDDAAFDCDSWSGLQNFVSGRGIWWLLSFAEIVVGKSDEVEDTILTKKDLFCCKFSACRFSIAWKQQSHFQDQCCHHHHHLQYHHRLQTPKPLSRPSDQCHHYHRHHYHHHDCW